MRPPLTILYFLFVLVISTTGFAQYHPFRTFIPKGFTILGRAAADINGDGHPDWVVALRNPYENMNPDTTRPLLLLLGNGKGGYRLVARNDSVVLCNNCGGVHGDPFQRVTAGEGWLSVRHFGGSGWRWTRMITFHYDRRQRQFLLISDGGRSWHVDSPKDGTRILNRPEDFGRITFQQFSYKRGFKKK